MSEFNTSLDVTIVKALENQTKALSEATDMVAFVVNEALDLQDVTAKELEKVTVKEWEAIVLNIVNDNSNDILNDWLAEKPEHTFETAVRRIITNETSIEFDY